MNITETKEKLNIINNYNLAQPIQHLSEKHEKKLYVDRMAIRKHAEEQAIKRYKKQERVIYLNHLRTFKKVSEITDSMKEKEEEWAEYLY